jgi:hypothetical protein
MDTTAIAVEAAAEIPFVQGHAIYLQYDLSMSRKFELILFPAGITEGGVITRRQTAWRWSYDHSKRKHWKFNGITSATNEDPSRLANHLIEQFFRWISKYEAKYVASAVVEVSRKDLGELSMGKIPVSVMYRINKVKEETK